MIRVASGSRLHFGVFSFGGGPGERFFGGAGMMVDEPRVAVSVRPAASWSATGRGAERALAFARQFAASFEPDSIAAHAIQVESMPPEHAGLGSGTQLGLVVARALAESAGKQGLSVEDLAMRVGRGRRSALGIHGFAHGGFLVEAGKREGESISPLVAHVNFPDDWRLVLTIPAAAPGLHGPAEIEAFRRLHAAGVPLPTDALCRLVLLGLLPALAARDLPAFGEALFEFNRKVGEAFASVQGGPYAGPRVTEVVEFMRGAGVHGVAQSSWGPAVCAVVPDEEKAAWLVRSVRARQGGNAPEIFVTQGRNGTDPRIHHAS
jgi:beta-ribofuranosylaminobenzene 5'-phosphate synthase